MQIKGSRLILYDRSGIFLGMGSQELYLLGYEDMEEFRNYHNDFADLFISKPGYIFKFQNFSWIDYTLHSGTPNRKVLIKTKNGKEIETSLNINEIFLNKEIGGANTCFCVELSNAPYKKEISSTSRSDTSPQIKDGPESFISEPTIILQDAPFKTVDFAEEPSLYNTDYVPSFVHEEKNEPNDFKMVINETPIPDTSVGIKLKFDDEILTPPSPQTYSSIDEIKINDLDFDVSEEHYFEDKHEDLLNDTNLFVSDIKPSSKEILPLDDFDLSAIADELGLDISLLAQILSEYLEELDLKMPIVQAAIDTNNIPLVKNEISKLKSIAHHLHILSLYSEFESFEKSLNSENFEVSKNTFSHLTQKVKIFKESVE